MDLLSRSGHMGRSFLHGLRSAQFGGVKDGRLKALVCITVLLLFEGCATADYAGIPLQPGRADPEVQEIARLARAGDKQAQFDLGKRFETGDGVAQNREQAITLFRQAASSSGGILRICSPPVGSTPGRTNPINQGTLVPGFPETRGRRLMSIIGGEAPGGQPGGFARNETSLALGRRRIHVAVVVLQALLGDHA